MEERRTEWAIGILAADAERLGEGLARAVPGEWIERAEGPVRVFLHRLDVTRRDEEASALAGPLADYVLDDCAAAEMARLVRSRYGTFDEADRAAIRRRAEERYRGSGTVIATRRRSSVVGRLRALLSDTATVLVDGVLRFRLPEWRRELVDVVDEAADLLILAREEQEFIRVLKAYRELEPPGPDRLHVLAEPGAFRVEDDRGQALTRVEARSEAADHALDGEELVAALVSLAPYHLTLHRGVDGSEARIVEGVFGRAAARCGGCPRCTRDELRPPG